MAGISYQSHGIAGEAEDYLKDHEARVETDTNRKRCTKVCRSMNVSARTVSMVSVIVMSVVVV